MHRIARAGRTAKYSAGNTRKAQQVPPAVPTPSPAPEWKTQADKFHRLFTLREGGEPMHRKDALKLLETPEGFAEVVALCRQASSQEEKKFSEQVLKIIEAVEREKPLNPDTIIGESTKVERASNPTAIWEQLVSPLSQLMETSGKKMQELDSLIEEVSGIIAALERIHISLDTFVCSSGSEVSKIDSEISGTLNQIRSGLHSKLADYSIRLDGLDDKVPIEEKQRAFEEAKESLLSHIKAINSTREEINQLNVEYGRLKQCRRCSLRKFSKAYYSIFWPFAYAILYFSNRFVDLSRDIPSKIKKIEEQAKVLRSSLDEKCKTVAEAYGKYKPYEENGLFISSLNALIQKLNERIVQANERNIAVREAAKALVIDYIPFRFVPVETDMREPDAKIKTIEQSRNLRRYYRGRVASALEGLSQLLTTLHSLRESYAHVYNTCSESKALIDSVPREAQQKSIIPSQSAFLESVRSLAAALELASNNTAILLSSRFEVPKNVQRLLRMVELYAEAPQEGVIGDAIVLIRTQQALETEYEEQKVIELLKALRRNTALRENGGDELEQKILASSSEGTKLWIAFKVFRAGRECTSPSEKIIYQFAINDLSSADRFTHPVLGDEISRIELVGMALPSMYGFLDASKNLMTDKRDRLNSQLFKHTTDDPREAEKWRVVRNGTGPHSASELGVRSISEMEHYIAASRFAVIHGVPIICGFGSPSVPTLFFVRNLAEDGLPGDILYTGFELSVRLSRFFWRTTYIRPQEELLARNNGHRLMTPLPRSVLV